MNKLNLCFRLQDVTSDYQSCLLNLHDIFVKVCMHEYKVVSPKLGRKYLLNLMRVLNTMFNLMKGPSFKGKID